MKVYELIQELAQYNPDTEVDFHVKATMDIDVEAEFDRTNEDDTQGVTVTADIDDDFNFDDITDKEHDPRIIINLEY